MMLIVLGGLPKSGKTSIVTHLKHDVVHINAELLLPQNIDRQIESIQKKLKITAWEQCLTQLSEALERGGVIIYDTCAANLNPIRPLILKAGIKGHQTLYVYVDRDPMRCSAHINKHVIESYKAKFIITLPEAQKAFNYLRIVKNNTDINTAAHMLDGIINETLHIC